MWGGERTAHVRGTLNSAATVVSWPFEAAKSIGVRPSLVATLRSAPACRSQETREGRGWKLGLAT